MSIITYARELRHNQTPAETLIWNRLRNKQLNGLKFKRQYPIGPYIVDFVNYQHKLVIELDGGQHNNEEDKRYDEKRTLFLKENGFEVLRFWDNEVHSNITGVLETILKTYQPHPSPLLRGEGTK